MPKNQTTTEIERRFLVAKVPELDGLPRVDIEQGYLVLKDHGRLQVRLRRIGTKFYQAYKRIHGEIADEGEIELTEAQFDVLWPHTEGRRVQKVRYAKFDGKRTIDLDVYRGPLDGLVVAEVEFDSLEESGSFEPPAWFGDEVEIADIHFEDGRPHVTFSHV